MKLKSRMIGGYIPEDLAEQFIETIGVYSITIVVQILARRFVNGQIVITDEDILNEKRLVKEQRQADN